MPSIPLLPLSSHTTLSVFYLFRCLSSHEHFQSGCDKHLLTQHAMHHPNAMKRSERYHLPKRTPRHTTKPPIPRSNPF